MLTILDSVPDGLIEADARRLHEVLPGPTLIELTGRREPALFVSVLLHGDEDAGLRAVQRLLAAHRDQTLPRSLVIFVGNVAAAREGRRLLPGQADFNRIWPGGEAADGPEAAMMQAIVDRMAERGLFASVDIHNNTGYNPHYGCVNRLDHRFLQLATLFSRTVVYFTRPRGVQSMAFAPLCPAVTVECGQARDVGGAAHAHEFLEACLRLSAIPDHPVAAHDIDLFHTVAVVRVPEEVSFGFDEAEALLRLDPDLERLNFQELPTGTELGRVSAATIPLEVRDNRGEDVAERFFVVDEGVLRLARPAMPSMLATNARAIRDDCLCYLMERVPEYREKTTEEREKQA